MISLRESEELHKTLIEEFGGTFGLRDVGALQSALERPFQTFDSRELYPGTLQKASALIESMLTNHPFIDGNKRTGYVLARLFLLTYGYDIVANQEDRYNFVIDIASGRFKYDEIFDWLLNHTVQLSRGA